MASAQEDGLIKFYLTEPNGNKHLVFQGNVSYLAGAGGAADGALGSVQTTEKWPFAPLSSIVAKNDWVLEVTFVPVGADGIDVSDSLWNIPITVKGVGMKHLSRGDFTNPTPADYTTVANIETVVGGYTITEGEVKFGGGKIWCDMQDDTA